MGSLLRRTFEGRAHATRGNLCRRPPWINVRNLSARLPKVLGGRSRGRVCPKRKGMHE